MKNILITGINGFIGRNISKAILQSYNCFGSGRQQSSVLQNAFTYIQSVLGNNDFVFTINNKIKEVDTIIHLAAALKNNSDIQQTNIKGIFQIIELAKQSNCKKLIYISSIPVIGTPLYTPITEKHPVFPKTVYHASKFFGETVLSSELKDITVIILRLPSPIGYDMPDNKIFSAFISNCLNNKNLRLYGHGTRIQNYINVKDIWRSIELALKYNKSNLFNIAAAESYSNIELATKCINITNSKSKIQFIPEEDLEENNKWIINTHLAKQELNFSPIYSIEESILERVKYHEDLHRQ